VLCRFLEVGAHPLAQVDRFAHIKHGSLRILEKITARLRR
jgi:hypothetical protein